jgi:hypothetical protein
MNTTQIIQALHKALVYEAAKQQVVKGSVDNLSMLVAVATGTVLRSNDLQEVYNTLYVG